LRLSTPSEVVAAQRVAGSKPAELPWVRAGAWVHRTLSTWLGDRDEDRGWDPRCEAKHAYDGVVASEHLKRGQLTRAQEQLAACEASDWFWWFGDYNPAAAVRDFALLFRHQLTSLYQALALSPPAHLKRPISIGHGHPEGGGVMRRA